MLLFQNERLLNQMDPSMFSFIVEKMEIPSEQWECFHMLNMVDFLRLCGSHSFQALCMVLSPHPTLQEGHSNVSSLGYFSPILHPVSHHCCKPQF